MKLLRLDAPNKNGDVFPSSSVLPIVKNEYFGHIELKTRKTSQTSHKVFNIRTESDESGTFLVGDIKILNTPAGLVLQDALNSDKLISMAPRLTGKVENGEIKPPISILSIDIVES